MAYHRSQKSIREAYDECFMQTDTREVTFQRVVNIVERRTTVSRPEVDYSQDFSPDWSKDRYTDADQGFINFQRKSTPPRQEGNAYYGGEARDDPQLRRQVEIRSRERTSPDPGWKIRGRPSDPTGPHRGRGSRVVLPPLPYSNRGQDKDGYKRRDSRYPLRERSPARRDPHAAAPPAPRAGFEGRGRSFSPDRESSYTYQQLQQRRKEQDDGHYWTSERSRASSRHTSNGPDDKTSHSPGVTQESLPPVSVVGPPEVPAAAGPEPGPAPVEDLKAWRVKAIARKALEIEELYAQDCQTFGTVVKLLVEKRPSLEEALQGPLRANLLELKQRCLDDLKHFIRELDQPSSGRGRAAGSPPPPPPPQATA